MLYSPPVDWLITTGRKAALSLIQCGPLPEHMAFIMDGNRRFARVNKIETVEGHNVGFETLANCLALCYESGIRCITVYAFSIENFKRTPYEVDGLMNMAKMRLQQIGRHDDLLSRLGVRIRFLGDVSLLRKDVYEVIEKSMEATKHNTRAVLNICAPYTSRDEITSAVRRTVEQYTHPKPAPARRGPFSESRIVRNAKANALGSVAEEVEASAKATATAATAAAAAPAPAQNSSADGSEPPSVFDHADDCAHTDLTTPTPPSVAPSGHGAVPGAGTPTPSLRRFRDPESISVDTLDENMYTCESPPVDILVRTSGVNRLSDFLLWQCHEQTDLVIVDTLWPQFGFWDFFRIILNWQWSRMSQISYGLARTRPAADLATAR